MKHPSRPRGTVADKRLVRMRVLLAVLLMIPAPLFSAVAPAVPERQGEWPHNGGNLAAQRYSPLTEIHPGNAQALEVAWRWSARNFGPVPQRRYITTPIMVDGILYATAGLCRTVVAIDPGSGETLWTHRLDEGATRTASAPRRNSGQGSSLA